MQKKIGPINFQNFKQIIKDTVKHINVPLYITGAVLAALIAALALMICIYRSFKKKPEF